jgi:nucleoside-diphosphate-sugar epimerase
MRVLILGGTGLISTQITQQLLARGDEVWHFNRGQRASGFWGVQFEQRGAQHRVAQHPQMLHTYDTSGDAPLRRTVTGDRKDAAAVEARMRELPGFDCVMDMIGFTPADAESGVRAFAGRTGHFICGALGNDDEEGEDERAKTHKVK